MKWNAGTSAKRSCDSKMAKTEDFYRTEELFRFLTVFKRFIRKYSEI